MPLYWFLGPLAGLLGVGCYALVGSRRPRSDAIVYGISFLCSVLALGASLTHLLTAPAASTLTLPLGLPWSGVHLRVDALSAFFLVIVNLGGAVTSWYGLGHGRHEQAPERVLPFFPAFLAAMNLVLLADDAFTFLLTWEFMSLMSWALVMAHHRQAGNAHAGYVYLLMAGMGTMALLLAFGVLAGADGGYHFADMRAGLLSQQAAALVLVLTLVGAGSKAGLFPLHVWLPLAHPAAPSHVSALMSGVMTKVAVYGFMRIVFDLLGEPAWWWGAVVLALGAVTAVLGVLYALMQHDLKRLLAYHTVENIGIIFIGLGLALAFQANYLNDGAALALSAALFHVFNHSLFKSLLFLGSGSVLSATGERDMERLGGLIHRMPWTALAFLIGSAAISALPPLNGFVSEWLTFQAILISPELPQWLLKFLVPAVGAALALSAALAGACFVKAFGITFLGRPRTPAAAQAEETDTRSLTALFVLAALCVLAGILPGLVIDALAPVVASLNGAVRLAAQASQPWLTLVPLAEAKNSYNGMLVLLFIVFSGFLSALLIHRLASRDARRGSAWDCGFPDDNPAGQYTAGSFAQPIRRMFGSVVFQARERVDMPAPGDLRPARMTVSLRDPAWDYGYLPLIQVVNTVAGRLNHLQFLTVRRYLTLVFSALILLLLGLAIWR
ncbi:MAG: hydrogenase 4 subunit B [Gammaproteobacteria bacterium]|nr:hydrogenase 4 subunit B [Gammaproteobacteria bacterium]MCP5425842.1 hydrogenase 4 subunit B [Gammaproteobacteria bacterium]